jgi:hypothetical protein
MNLTSRLVCLLAVPMLILVFLSSSPAPLAAQDVQVNSADPPSAEQGTVNLDVIIKGKGFKKGAIAKFFLTGTDNPAGVVVNSTTFVSNGEVRANINVSDNATVSSFDVVVQNSDGRTGKGVGLFSVVAKGKSFTTCSLNMDPSANILWSQETQKTRTQFALKAEPNFQTRTQAGAQPKMPIWFEPNLGQVKADADFFSRLGGAIVLVARGHLAVRKEDGFTIRVGLMGANRQVAPEGISPRDSYSSYFRGADPKQWRTRVPHFDGVRYSTVYPGVDVIYYERGGHLEFDFVVAPGADVRQIRMQIEGGSGRVIPEGAIVVASHRGEEIRLKEPVAYQKIGGERREVKSRFVELGSNQFGFRVGEYDASRPLVIDPVLLYSTYLGGTADDRATSVAVDGAGVIYVSGYTRSADFPATAGAFDPTLNGTGEDRDMFLVKLNPNGNGAADLEYATFLGGGTE